MSNEESLQILPNDQIRNALTELLKSKFKNGDYSLTIELASGKGDNFIGIIYRAKAKQNATNAKECSNISIIIKVPPENEIRREHFFARPSFLREALCYDEIIPMMIKFQREKNIDDIDGFYNVPKCYQTLTEDKFEGIFLEDLAPKGFRMFSRFDKMTFENAAMVMKSLGKLHAISLALKDQRPEIMEKYKSMKDTLTERKSETTKLNEFLGLMKARAEETVSADEDSELLRKFKQFTEGKDLFELLKVFVNGESAEPYAVICHGDCWTNNILFQFENDKPIDLIFIDWQISRYASPACDITYFLFCCTTGDLRQKYYKQFMDIYYESLSQFLQRLGTNPNDAFPRVEFDHQLKTFGCFGLVTALMLLPILTSKAEDIPDLDELSGEIDKGEIKNAASFYSNNSIDAFNKRMREVIRDVIDFGYL